METKEIKKIEEKYDTSKDVWSFYKEIYTWNQDANQESVKYWDIEAVSTSENIERRWAKITDAGIKHYNIDRVNIGFENVLKENITISGDIIFNFSEGHHYTKQIRKYDKLLNLIEDERERKKQKEQLKQCMEKNHTKENCALLLSQGKLQIAKKSIGDDRGDTFIWALNDYFIGNSEIILNSATPEWVGVLRVYLDSFKDSIYPSESIYRYCEEFYNIMDRKLIDHLINSGAKAIDTPERVCEYVELVQIFWRQREEFFEKLDTQK